MSLLVLAAGMGSRFGGVKQVEAVGPDGETALEYSVYDALDVGFDEVVFLVRSSIEADFRAAVLSRLPRRIPYRLVFQELDSLLGPAELETVGASGRAKPWGTGHALLCSAGAIRGSFAVINADDFYGREEFTDEAKGLAAGEDGSSGEIAPAAPPVWCMAGFLLGNTTSPHGAVSRGICEIGPGGELLSVIERTRIERGPLGLASTLPDGSTLALTGEEIVSMNLWGFTAEAFALIEPLFRGFLARLEGEDAAGAEFYLPEAVNLLVARRLARVAVLPTPASWFGITYRGDLAPARARICDLLAAGSYPSPLWGRR
jgi:hypothetical protein